MITVRVIKPDLNLESEVGDLASVKIKGNCTPMGSTLTLTILNSGISENTQCGSDFTFEFALNLSNFANVKKVTFSITDGEITSEGKVRVYTASEREKISGKRGKYILSNQYDYEEVYTEEEMNQLWPHNEKNSEAEQYSRHAYWRNPSPTAPFNLTLAFGKWNPSGKKYISGLFKGSNKKLEVWSGNNDWVCQQGDYLPSVSDCAVGKKISNDIPLHDIKTINGVLKPERQFHRMKVHWDSEFGYLGFGSAIPYYPNQGDTKIALTPALIQSQDGINWTYKGILPGELELEIEKKRLKRIADLTVYQNKWNLNHYLEVCDVYQSKGTSEEINTVSKLCNRYYHWSDPGGMFKTSSGKWMAFTNGFRGMNILEADSPFGPWEFVRNIEGGRKFYNILDSPELTWDSPNTTYKPGGVSWLQVIRVSDTEWHLWVVGGPWPDMHSITHYSSSDGYNWAYYGDQPEILRMDNGSGTLDDPWEWRALSAMYDPESNRIWGMLHDKYSALEPGLQPEGYIHPYYQCDNIPIYVKGPSKGAANTNQNFKIGNLPSCYGDIVIHWFIDDEIKSNSNEFNHVFATPGTYKITANIRGPWGDLLWAYDTITIE
jgi:hypothetical protein